MAPKDSFQPLRSRLVLLALLLALAGAGLAIALTRGGGSKPQPVLLPAAGDAGLVADPGQGHPRLVVGVGHGCYERLLHGLLLGLEFADDEGTGAVIEAAAAVDPHAVVARVLDRAQLQHAGA